MTSRLFGQRDFRLLWLGESVSNTGTAVSGITLPLLAATTLHASTFDIGLLDAFLWLPWLLIGLPAGAWVDRLPYRSVMVVSDLVATATFISLPIAAWLGVLRLSQLFAVALLAGLASVFFNTACAAYLPCLVGRDRLVEGNTRLQASEAAANVAGPGLGGLLAQSFGAAAGMLANALSFCVSAVCVLSIRSGEATRARRAGPRRLGLEIAEGVRFVLGDRLLRLLTFVAALGNLGSSAFGALVVVFLLRDVGLGPGTVGGLLMAEGAGGVLGACAAAQFARRLGAARAMLLLLVCTAPAGLLIPLTRAGPGLLFFVAGALIKVGGLVAYSVISRSFRQACCTPEMLGRTAATTRVITYGTVPLGGLLGGSLGAALGPRDALWVVMAAGLLPSAWLLASPLRKLRDLPAIPAQEASVVHNAGQSGSGPGPIAPDGSAVELYALLRPGNEPAIVREAVPAGAAILELGCGAGRITHELIALGYDVIAVDESPEMIERVCGNALCSPIEDLRLDREFDAVLLGSHLINMAGPELRRGLLDTCRAHVRPGGAVLIQRQAPGSFDEPVVRERGDFRFEVRDIGPAADGATKATLEYRVGERVWTQHVTVYDLDDDELATCLQAASLRIGAFLTDDRTWLRAVPMVIPQ